MELEVEGRRPVGRPKSSEIKHEEANHHRRYGREEKTVEATHITSDPRSGKLGMVNDDDDDDDDN